MLRPEQVCVDNDDRNSRQQEAIEKHIDQRLKSGVLRFPTTRGMWLKENIEAVLERYRSVGWACSYENGVGFCFAPTADPFRKAQ